MRSLSILVLALVLASCGGMQKTMMHSAASMMPTPNMEAPVAAESNGITLRDPWARVGTKGDNSATYLVINNAAGDDTLVSATGTVAAAIELHTVIDDNGTMKMVQVEGGIPIPAAGNQLLKPGSYHIMLIGLNQDLSKGDTFTLTLTFANAGSVDVTAEVR